MKLTLKELRNYIRNAMAPATADRPQLTFLGRKTDVADTIFDLSDENVIDDKKNPTQPDEDSQNFGVHIDDPYVTQDGPAPSNNHRKLGRTGS
jgi:hypothetical protein